MGCFNSKSAANGSRERSGQDVTAQYRTTLINKLGNPMITKEKQSEIQEELERFMGFSEREQEIYASLRLAPARTTDPPTRRRLRSVPSMSGSAGSTEKIPIAVTMHHETAP